MTILLSTKEVADRLKITPAYVRYLISKDVFLGRKIGTDWVIEESELEKFRKQRRYRGER